MISLIRWHWGTLLLLVHSVEASRLTRYFTLASGGVNPMPPAQIQEPLLFQM